MTIEQNLEQIRERIVKAAQKVKRDPKSIKLVAVSKKKPVKMIENAIKAGQTIFGENYVQDIKDKYQQVGTDVSWHFIGHLQSNKIKYIRGKVAMIETVDRLSLAQDLSLHWGKLNKHLDILIQVNVGGEESKSGVAPEDLETLLVEVAKLPYIHVKGLMAIPPFCENPEDSRPYFRQLKELAEKMATREIENIEMAEISMGMSHDFDIAIEEGATIVRVGSAIFGSR